MTFGVGTAVVVLMACVLGLVTATGVRLAHQRDVLAVELAARPDHTQERDKRLNERADRNAQLLAELVALYDEGKALRDRCDNLPRKRKPDKETQAELDRLDSIQKSVLYDDGISYPKYRDEERSEAGRRSREIHATLNQDHRDASNAVGKACDEWALRVVEWLKASRFPSAASHFLDDAPADRGYYSEYHNETFQDLRLARLMDKAKDLEP